MSKIILAQEIPMNTNTQIEKTILTRKLEDIRVRHVLQRIKDLLREYDNDDEEAEEDAVLQMEIIVEEIQEKQLFEDFELFTALHKATIDIQTLGKDAVCDETDAVFHEIQGELESLFPQLISNQTVEDIIHP
jgi:hemerythrin-like domain-containing protein